jgi:hypothetical protein
MGHWIGGVFLVTIVVAIARAKVGAPDAVARPARASLPRPQAAAVTTPSDLLMGSGVVEPCGGSTSIGTTVPGVVMEVLVKAGQRVHRGDPLYRMDDRPFHGVLLVRRAALRLAEAELARLEINGQDISRFRPGGSVCAIPSSHSTPKYRLDFVQALPYVVPKKTPAGGGSSGGGEPRVLQVIYAIAPGEHSLYVGQSLDVSINVSGYNLGPKPREDGTCTRGRGGERPWGETGAQRCGQRGQRGPAWHWKQIDCRYHTIRKGHRGNAA